MFHQNLILGESSKAESKRVLQILMEVEFKKFLNYVENKLYQGPRGNYQRRAINLSGNVKEFQTGDSLRRLVEKLNC